MTSAVPDARSRWRCAHCGNLTRFDVVRTTQVREFWHVDLAGEPVVEESELLGGGVQTVTCRWCGASDAIEIVARPEPGAPEAEPGLGGTP
ncbi:MAG: hypothetical protein EPO13_00720 [Actinomycetota bacterium]|nr:MAG: hypothetical protein EPO13_00720 [Actinomycetota bacterium]